MTGSTSMLKRLPESRRLPIQKKLVGLTMLIGVGIIAFLIFFYYSFSASLQNEKKAQSRHLSESAMGIIDYFYQLEESGQLAPSVAQEYAMNALQSATYGDNGYFWINSGDGELLMQPYTPERVGINQIDWTDGKGNLVFLEFVSKAKVGGDWVSYSWPKPNSTFEYPKISYVAYFPPWDWVLGTGLYLDDMQNNVFWTVLKASGVLLVGFLTFIATTIFVVNYFVIQLGELAVRDTLTNLYTKRFLKEVLPTILDKHKRLRDSVLAVVFIDIDHFKNVNDSYGHDIGDKVLKRVSATMMNTTRPDDYCIRFGGDEFVLIGFFDDETAVVNTVERIRTEAAQLYFCEIGLDFHLCISAGIALHDNERGSFDDTLKRADMKLYESKAAGRNRVSI
jgi:diguanylate cyclase (GGDEF)-like protein